MRKGPFSAQQAIVMAILGSLVLFDGMDTQVLGLIARDMTRDLGLPMATFGVVFSAGLLGGVFGSALISPLADRVLGRKTIAVWAMAVASLSTIATPLATNLAGLLGVRFIAGVGLGAVVPSVFTLVSEFAPKRFARVITSCLIGFMPLGSLLGGLIGRAVVPGFGWRMLLYVGGSLTLALTVLAAWTLPESVYFLVRVRKDLREAVRVAKRFLPQRSIGTLVVNEPDGTTEKKQPIVGLFSAALWKLTLLIWGAYILNQAIVYFVSSWTPALLQKSGLTLTAGMDAAMMFGLGGALGTVAQGWLATRYNIYAVMFVEMVLYLIAILSLAFVLSGNVVAPVMVFFMAAGICAYHSGFVLILLESYPNGIRTTAFGWAFGIGRIGATSAPVLAGVLVGAGWRTEQIFAAAAVPGLMSALALLGVVILRGQRGGGPTNDPVGPAEARSG
jgi:AAHS family 4-hydroxybenzoate transporter-like MFS transporter